MIGETRESAGLEEFRRLEENPPDIVISLDRQEIGQDSRSAVQALEQALQIPVVSIVKLQDLIEMLEESGEYSEFLGPVVNYREQYGA